MKKYGKLKIIKEHKEKGKRLMVHALCDCGNTIYREKKSLVSGNTKSCGCLRRILSSERMSFRQRTHGESKTYFYKRWWHIRVRCLYEWDKDYKNYGGRGIKCEWTNYEDFKKDMYVSFLKHVKKHGKENTTIERIDVNGNYCKKNCKWVTRNEQSLNKRDTVKMTYKGTTKTMSQWARELNTSHAAIKYRIDAGVSVEKIIETPFKHSNKFFK